MQSILQLLKNLMQKTSQNFYKESLYIVIK